MAQQTYSVEDKNLTRLSCIHQRVTTKVLRYVFQNGSSDRPHNMSLLDYYSDKGINSTRFRNRLFEAQRTRVETDFQGDTFDITLLSRCLRCGSHGLAQENDEKWNRDDKASIESLLTIVKNRRNHLAHDQPKYTNQQLLNEAQELKDDLKQILQFSEHLFNIPTATIDQEISNVEDEVKKYLHDEFQPTTFEEYKKELFFDAQSEFLNDKGLKETIKQYEKCLEGEVSTTDHLIPDLSLSTEDVYTDMELKGESGSGCDKSLEYENFLQDEKSQNLTDSVTVVNGPAGIGKTTFTKKMILDFINQINVMKDLLTHDHLLKAECRNTRIKSFVQMLHHRMPDVSKHFKAGDLEIVMLAQKVFVILDGLNELNTESAKLFEELLSLKKERDITLVITTRPEKMKYIEERLRFHHLKMRHVQLMGIPTEKRDEMVKKYHSAIADKFNVSRDIQGLLKYLQETEYRLADLWRSPYILCLVTILWTSALDVENITTAPELYREILQLYKTRLNERLASNEATPHSQESERQKKIDTFMCCLARESLIGLIKNQINLPQDAYERLAEVCKSIKIPIEEMINAFLKRVPGADIIYSFAHKGIQDYLAAYFIWLNIIGKIWGYDVQGILDSVADLLIQNNVPQSVRQNALRSMAFELKSPGNSSFVREILNELHGSSEYELSKFQNIFICLLGMFYSEKDMIDDDIKLEVLMLLQDTGIHERKDWITILNTVRCDEFVASFISKQPKILDGHIQITDSSVSAYVSLMKALKPPLKNAHRIKMDIDVKGDLTDANELLKLISSHQFQVMRILINGNNSQEYVAMLKALPTPLKHAKEVMIDMTDIKLLNSRELMNLIEKNNFTVRTLQVSDFEINDSHLREYISVFKSLPHILESDNQMGVVNVNVKRDLTGAEELIELVSNHQLKVRLLINDSNFNMHNLMLKTLTKTLKDAHEVKVDVYIDEDITSITELLQEIKKKDVSIGKFKVGDIQITDENFEEYTDLMKVLPMVDAHEVKVDICIDEDITTITELLQEIKKNGFRVGKFKVKDIQITGENFKEYTDLMQGLPMVDAHEVKVDICIDDDITTITELLQEIKKNGFRVGKFKVRDIQINDKNFEEYTGLVKGLQMVDAHEVKVDICIYEDITTITELLREIKKNGFRVGKFKVKDLQITDENFEEYTNLVKGLPKVDIHEVKVDICIDEDITTITELLQEIKKKGFSVRKFKVSDIQITDENFEEYFNLVKWLPKVDAHEVKVDICIDEYIGNIHALLQEIKKNGFSIRKFKVSNIQITDENFEKYTYLMEVLPEPLKNAYEKELMNQIRVKAFQLTDKNLMIKDETISVFTEVLRSLPTLVREEDRMKKTIIIKRKTSGVNTVLKEIARNKFPVDIILEHDFKHPESSASEEALNNVFERCPVEYYTGRMFPDLRIPLLIKGLSLSVEDTPSYLQLRSFLDTEHQLEMLGLSVNIWTVEVEQLKPITKLIGPILPYMFFPDIGLQMKDDDMRKVSEVAQRLIPIVDKMFGSIIFPRLRLKGEEIKSLLSCMKEKGVNIRGVVVFPSSCRPSSRHLEEELEQHARTTLHCGIKWGKIDRVPDRHVYDIDSWWGSDIASV